MMLLFLVSSDTFLGVILKDGNIVAVGATLLTVLTYEDVTNVDSLGVVTARIGLEFLLVVSMLLVL